MKFTTINPATEDVIAEFETMPLKEVFEIAEKCNTAYQSWKDLNISDRIVFIENLVQVLRKNKEQYAKIITTEMGKPINESIAEIEKCAWMVEVYGKNAETWLAEEPVSADGKEHRVIFQPLGVILSIMPWNFPFWQALRFAVPTLIAGNVSILKHSNVVPQCALSIEKAFKETGLPENVFRTIITDHKAVEELIKLNIIRGVSFTGSTEAGMKIAETAGRNLKKMVLELGGSDPFIVLDDADLEYTAKNAVLGRTINTGQSCIAAKRFIVSEKVAEQFSNRFSKLMSELKVGDPMDEHTQIGPLVNQEAFNQVEDQVKDAIDKGARILTGGKKIPGKGYFYSPTVLTNTTSDMKVVSEEVFAPVAPIIVVKNNDAAIKIANSTEFGLGGSVWTNDIRRGEQLARQVESGTVFVNSITKSDPRMPFGGVKTSGFGRELAKYGLREFVNVKGLNIYEHG
jgi:acyl-CoA reductase-like NAD-dependent aldehyde dehydrogenase